MQGAFVSSLHYLHCCSSARFSFITLLSWTFQNCDRQKHDYKFIQAVKGRGCNRHFFCGVRSIFYAFEQHLSLNAIGGHFDQGRSSYQYLKLAKSKLKTRTRKNYSPLTHTAVSSAVSSPFSKLTAELFQVIPCFLTIGDIGDPTVEASTVPTDSRRTQLYLAHKANKS